MEERTRVVIERRVCC